MEFVIAGRKVEIDFDFATMYKINTKLGTVNQDTGGRNEDGVGSLFYRVLEREESALVDLISIAVKAGKKAPTEEQIIEGIGKVVEEDGTTDRLFQEIEDEMVASGFFKGKISKYVDNMKKTVGYLETQENVNDTQIQVINDMIGKMSDAIS